MVLRDCHVSWRHPVRGRRGLGRIAWLLRADRMHIIIKSITKIADTVDIYCTGDGETHYATLVHAQVQATSEPQCRAVSTPASSGAAAEPVHQDPMVEHTSTDAQLEAIRCVNESDDAILHRTLSARGLSANQPSLPCDIMSHDNTRVGRLNSVWGTTIRVTCKIHPQCCLLLSRKWFHHRPSSHLWETSVDWLNCAKDCDENAHWKQGRSVVALAKQSYYDCQ